MRQLAVVVALIALLSVLTRTGSNPDPAGPAPCPALVGEQHLALSQRNASERTQAWFKDRGGEWAVLEYQVNHEGALSNVTVVRTSGPKAEPARLAELVRAWEPVPVLPAGVESLHVVELFWRPSAARLAPGSLEAQLAELDDGRWLRY